MRIRNWLVITVLGFLVIATLLGCGPFAAREKITMLAGSEIKDMEPLLEEIERELGIDLDITYIGTLEGAERLMAGEEMDMAWFSHAKYISLLEEAASRIKAQEKIMLSPVVLGIKESKAREFGWLDNDSVTWKEILEKAESGELRFAMTNPASSNSGFSALVGAAAALSGKADALQVEDVQSVSGQLQGLFKGQALTSGSSGWLAEQYVREENRLDGMINYELVLLGLNKKGELKEKFHLIYPQEGIITADYPLLLIDDGKREIYNRLVEKLRESDIQERIMLETLRRPVIAQTPLSSDFSDQLLVELPFPSKREVIDQLLFSYLDVQSRPAHTFYVLDVSGSMGGDRLEDLKTALLNLTGMDTSLSGQFARFRNRERVTMILFNGNIQDTRSFEVDLDDPRSFDEMREYVNSLEAGGRTAIYSALAEAYQLASQAQSADPERQYSIVLLSDGVNNSGLSDEEFYEVYHKSADQQAIKTFSIMLGEADVETMQNIASATGGRAFDAKKEALSLIFKQIRGYQ